MNNNLTHTDESGQAVMTDVSDKKASKRKASAGGRILMNKTAYNALKNGTAKKGDVLAAARIAGIMAAKRCPELIPLCHPIKTEKISVDFFLSDDDFAVDAECFVQCTEKTGAEMEALCGAGIALLTIYDMCKALDRSMTIQSVCLLEKEGGKSGHYIREPEDAD